MDDHTGEMRKSFCMPLVAVTRLSCLVELHDRNASRGRKSGIHATTQDDREAIL